MAYCTEAQVEALLAIAIATTAATGGKTIVLSADQLTAQIANADAEIDAELYKVPGLSLPLSTVPAAIMECSRMIAGANALDAAGLPQVTEDGSMGLARGYRTRAAKILAALVAHPNALTATAATSSWDYDTTLSADLVDFEGEAANYVEER